MSIEQAMIDDAQEILALQKLAYQSEAEIYNDFTIPPLHQTLDEIKAEFCPADKLMHLLFLFQKVD